MSYADQLFIQNCKDILTNGVWDTDHEVRPVWEDGTPAHTIKKFGIVNRYDLRKSFRLSHCAALILNPQWMSCCGSGRKSPTMYMT